MLFPAVFAARMDGLRVSAGSAGVLCGPDDADGIILPFKDFNSFARPLCTVMYLAAKQNELCFTAVQ